MLVNRTTKVGYDAVVDHSLFGGGDNPERVCVEILRAAGVSWLRSAWG